MYVIMTLSVIFVCLTTSYTFIDACQATNSGCFVVKTAQKRDKALSALDTMMSKCPAIHPFTVTVYIFESSR